MSSNKKFNKKKLIFFIILVLFVFISIGGVVSYFSKPKIERVLMSSDYSYLPVEAQNYIKEVYEQTGEIILTEKNKEENTPYLNPLFVIYLGLSEEEKNNVYDIPESYTIDYVYNSDYENINLPSIYDLRNVDGKNYITPMQDQGNLGLCWSFATIEQAESYLMINKQESYNENVTERFSVRQMDYAMSSDGIIKYDNKFNAYHNLTAGGNFYMSSSLASNGLTFVDNSYMEYNESTDLMYMEDVLNYSDSIYETNATIVMPNLSSTATSEETENYLNSVKSLIVKYGGAYVGTQSPNASCGSLNSDGTYVISVDNYCVQNAGHAMQIIGWDDDYEYAYCRTSNEYSSFHSGDISSCSESNLVTGKGAWLLKNSWGTSVETEPFQYVYLAYNSLNSNIAFTTEMSKMDERTWDNNYHENILDAYYWADRHGVAVTDDSTTFSKVSSSSEKLEKIKFLSYSTNGEYSITFFDDNSEIYSIDVNVEYPGIYTVDFSDAEYYFSGENINVSVSSLNDTSLIAGSISVFTSNTDTIPVVKTADVEIENKYYKTTDLPDYEFGVYSQTRNIKSTDTVSYYLYDEEGNDVSNYMTIVNAVNSNDVEVAANDVNAHLIIKRELGRGNYKLKIVYDGYEFFSNISLGNILYISGEGTESSPFLISNEEELKVIYDCLRSEQDLTSARNNNYYKLVNDITLTGEWTPIGDDYYSFTGGFDGDDHTIYGLKVNGSSSAGLFGYVESGTIKNLTIKDADITCSGNNCGILVGTVNGSVNVNNINIVGGTISGNSSVGTLMGSGSISRTGKIVIDKVFSSATVYASDYAGLIGHLSNDYGYVLSTNISNVLNVGNVDLRNLNGNINNSSLIVGFVHNKSLVNMNNVIATGRIYDNEGSDYNSLIGYVYDNYSIYGSKVKNSYYVNGVLPFQDISESYSDYEVLALKKNVNELKDETLYSSWDGFSDNWSINVVNDIKRIPILNGVDFEYTSILDISLENSNLVNLYDYITPKIDAAKNISYQIADDSVISIDSNGNIKGLKVGTTTIHVISDYDGYDNDVQVEVTVKANPEVHFYANNGTDDMKIQITSSSLDFDLEDNTFVKEGYKLKEWNTKVDGSGNSYANMANMSALVGDIDLYAIWEPISYSIIYNYNEEFEEIVENVIYDEEVSIIDNTNEKEGYKFVQWNTKMDGTGTSYNSGDIVSNLTTIDGDKINLYAIWERTVRTITYDANGGTGSMGSVTAEKGTKVTISSNLFSKVGYTFDSWNTKNDGSGTKYYANNTLTLQNDITLYAQWMANYYTIYYLSNGGKGSMSYQYCTYDKEGTLTLNTFTKEGYIFSGWNTKADGSGTSFDDGATYFNLTSESGERIYLYAQWEPYNYIITFDSNGGDGTMSDMNVDFDESVALSSNLFTKVGYTFTGWNTEADGSGTAYTNGQTIKNLSNEDGSTIKLYAQWSANTYEIVFDANGGTGTMTSVTATYDVDVVLPENTFTKDGLVFTGWNTEADGSGTTYTNGQSIKNLSSENGSTIKLFAQWSTNTYEIVFDANGGNGTMTNVYATYDVDVILPENTFTKDGFVFTGWNTKSDGSGTSYSDKGTVKNLVVSGGSITLYAIWAEVDSFSFSINDYEYVVESKLVDNIPIGTLIDDYKKKIIVNGNGSLEVDLGEKTVMFTGSKTRIYNNGTIVVELTNIVRGDVNGDAKISALDYVKVKNHIMNTNIITDEVYMRAADANLDNKITALDYVRIKNIILAANN